MLVLRPKGASETPVYLLQNHGKSLKTSHNNSALASQAVTNFSFILIPLFTCTKRTQSNNQMPTNLSKFVKIF